MRLRRTRLVGDRHGIAELADGAPERVLRAGRDEQPILAGGDLADQNLSNGFLRGSTAGAVRRTQNGGTPDWAVEATGKRSRAGATR